VHRQINPVAGLQPRQVKQRRVKNESLRISNLGNGLDHDVKLCLTPVKVKPKKACGENGSKAANGIVIADDSSRITLPVLPSDDDWGLKLVAGPEAH
jgi:hypothetical protein